MSRPTTESKRAENGRSETSESKSKERGPNEQQPFTDDRDFVPLNNDTIVEEEDPSDEGNENGEFQFDFNNKRIILQKFTIYNSKSAMYIVGSNAKETLFRILEININPSDQTQLDIIEDKNYFYTRKDMVELIAGLNESIEGGIHRIAQAFGLLGFIRFTKCYYLCLVTKCSQVAVIGGRYIYHIDETKLIPLDISYKGPGKYSDEEKLLGIFKYLDLGRTFYFSYSYDITNTLQTNFIRHKKMASKNQYPLKPELSKRPILHEGFDSLNRNERFVWNNVLLEPVLSCPEVASYEWFQSIIHGFIDQAKVSFYGRMIYITIIARRSRHFAGARFLKRGVNDKGNVANEVETEQIVSDMLVSSFHDPKYGFFNNPRFTSFVQHRGSIPLYWTQDLNKLPKPPIEVNLSDPYYQSSAIHFNNLFKRYGLPIIILNLIKTKERQPRELKLNQHFKDCVTYLNKFLPKAKKLQFIGFDMSKNSKKNLDVIGPLQKIAKSSIAQIGFFHNGINLATTKIQKGIIRTNCIDCLDRTNAAQFITCKEALYYQLSSLGYIPEGKLLEYDSDLINILTEMFHDHGDTIAIQYGGSNLVNTMDSYRRINQWSSHTRDVLNSVKRMYSNSFMDLIRQEAINLFLGNYVYDPSKPKLWELQNDYHLHNDASNVNIRSKRSYVHWYNDSYLSDNRFYVDLYDVVHGLEKLMPYPEYNDNWFNEFYMPRRYQALKDVFQYNMNSNTRYFPSTVNDDTNFEYSPFESRKPILKSNNEMSDGEALYNSKDHSEVGGRGVEEKKADKSVEKLGGRFDKQMQMILPNNYQGLDSYGNTSSHQTLSQSKEDNAIQNIGVSEKDADIYYEQVEIGKLLNQQANQAQWRYRPKPMRMSEDDCKVYRFFTSYSSSLDIYNDSGLLNTASATANSQDLKIYANYLGMDRDAIFELNAEDDYFR